MKIVSKYLIYWAISFLVLTATFRFGLSSFLEAGKYDLVILIASLYAILIFIAGWVFGKAHGMKSIKFDLGLSFNLTGFVIFSLVSLLWFRAGMNSGTESIQSVYLAMLIWGIFLVTHIIIFFITRKDTIKGIHKSDIFD